jgi:hypothetical protein
MGFLSLTELRRQAVALAEAQSAVAKCTGALGDWTANEILVKLDSASKDVQDKIEILMEGTCD